MKKRIITVALVLALLATCFAGTYAYLQDTDAAVNTMTVGDVTIAQYEHKLVDGKLVKLDTTKTMQLFPVVHEGSGTYPTADNAWKFGNLYSNLDTSDGTTAKEDRYADLWNAPNVVDKMVSVENTGDHGAYVRTIVLVPAAVDEYVVLNRIAGMTWDEDKVNGIVYNGDTYNAVLFTYKRADGILEPGQSTGPSIMQVLLTNNVENDTFDEKYDEGIDIVVVSQAVQAAGFDGSAQALKAAFGEITAENIAKWVTEAVAAAAGK